MASAASTWGASVDALWPAATSALPPAATAARHGRVVDAAVARTPRRGRWPEAVVDRGVDRRSVADGPVGCRGTGRAGSADGEEHGEGGDGHPGRTAHGTPVRTANGNGGSAG